MRISERPPGNRRPFLLIRPVSHQPNTQTMFDHRQSGPEGRDHEVTDQDIHEARDITSQRHDGAGNEGKGSNMLAPLSTRSSAPIGGTKPCAAMARARSPTCSSPKSCRTSPGPRRSAPSARPWSTCLEGAIARREPWGVWGGQMFLNGKILATKRRRGRPPKTPRPEDQLPEIPVPVHLRGYLRSA